MKSTISIDCYGHKQWLNEAGGYHREDGPALECTDGSKHFAFV